MIPLKDAQNIPNVKILVVVAVVQARPRHPSGRAPISSQARRSLSYFPGGQRRVSCRQPHGSTALMRISAAWEEEICLSIGFLSVCLLVCLSELSARLLCTYSSACLVIYLVAAALCPAAFVYLCIYLLSARLLCCNTS